MRHVTGIGGLFFRSENSEALAKWYEEHLGITAMGPTTPEPWKQDAGYTVFSPFTKDTKYFGRDEQQFMVNFRVIDLDGLLSKLEAAGVRIDEEIVEDEVGKFAWIYDPEGNRIELWEPYEMAS